jgi:putative membrane protein
MNYLRFESEIITNNDSTARDHLALERTYLAWNRMALSFVSVGLVIIQFFNKISAGIGIFFMIIGCVFLGIGTYRYFKVTNLLINGQYETSKKIVLGISILFVILIIIASILIILNLIKN